MHKQMDPNFVPCFFLKSSFSFLLIKREKLEEWQEKEQRKYPDKRKS